MRRDKLIGEAKAFVQATADREPFGESRGVGMLPYVLWPDVAEMMEAYRESVDAKRAASARDVARKLIVSADDLENGGFVGPSDSAVLSREAAQTIELLKSQLLNAEVRIGAAFEHAVKGSGGCWPSWVYECQRALKLADGIATDGDELRKRLQLPGDTPITECLNIVSRLVAADKEKSRG
jgi:hypothetical protein